MTDLLYLPDNDYETEFTATVETVGKDYIVMDETLFYPEGGGQPADDGHLEWADGSANVVDVQKTGGDVQHVIQNLQGELPAVGDMIHGEIDEERRAKHRRMHTAQHVLSKVVLDEYGASTAGNQIHADWSRIDFEPADFSDEDLERIQEQTNAIIEQDLAVEKKEMPRATVEERVADGRTNLDLIPDAVDPLRVIEIADFDICPCGGTHVNRLGEIGPIRIIERLSKGDNVERVKFELVE